MMQQALKRVDQGAAAPMEQALSERERDVLRLLAYGYSNKEVAYQLTIGVKTVETDKTRTMGKLRVVSRAELVRHALEHGRFDS